MCSRLLRRSLLCALIGAALLVVSSRPVQGADTTTIPYLDEADEKLDRMDRTPLPIIDVMFDMVNLQPGDHLVDLGSGDGRIVVAAARKGIEATGIEIVPERLQRSRKLAEQSDVAERTTFIEGDFFETSFSTASVVTLYLHPDINAPLQDRLLKHLKPGARIVSLRYDFPDWTEDHKRFVEHNDTSFRLFAWTVPARIDRRWVSTKPEADLTVDQSYQTFSVRGTLKGATCFGAGGRLHGRFLTTVLTCGGDDYRLSGYARDGHIEARIVHDGERRPITLKRSKSK